jgi:hypothetical protein
MVPLKVDPVCCQLSLNVPVKAPPYLPDQLPDRSTAAAGALEVGGAAVELAVVETLALAGGVEVVVDLAPLLLHPVASTAKAPTTETSSMPRMRRAVGGSRRMAFPPIRHFARVCGATQAGVEQLPHP